MQESLNEVESETVRMGAMINDLLLLAQADSGAFSSRWDRWNWTRCCSTSFDRRRIAERAKGPGALDIRLGSEDQALVYGDAERLRQLLLNLADNAVKYTPAGGAITFSLENAGDWVRVSVADTGIGIQQRKTNSTSSTASTAPTKRAAGR